MGNFDVTTPAGSDLLSLGDDKIREFKTAVREALRAGAVAGDDIEGVEAIFPGSSPSTAPVYRYRGLKGTTAARPAAGQYGLYFDTTRSVLQRDNGTSWEDIGQVVLDGSITEAKLSASVAGDGLSGGANTPLAVNVDNSTIEISSDILRLKDAGITQAKLGFPVFSFGDGSDGDLTVPAGTTTVNGLKKYNNVTVDVGGTLTHDTDRALTMLVKGTLTLNGAISVNGKSTTVGGVYSGAGGGGGGGGPSKYNGPGTNGIDGGHGPYVTIGTGGLTGVGDPSYVEATAGVSGVIQSYLSDTAVFGCDKGAKGGTGGDGKVAGAGYRAGGAGGNGGGCVKIFAKNIVFGGSNSISANGSNGSVGTAGTGDDGSGGGGGGGSGGGILIIYNSITGSPTVTVTGGSGGAGGSSAFMTGKSGGSGSSGLYVLLEIA